MRKVLFAALIVAAATSANAQYKKASFLTKGGRTYDLGATGRFMGDGRSAGTGFLFSYGRDKGKRSFHWFDLEVLLPMKFSFSATDVYSVPNQPVAVSGKTTTALIYRYNYAYYLMDNSNPDIKVLPFVTAGINLVIGGNNFKEEEGSSYSYTDPSLSRSGVSYGANLGAGFVYNFSPKVGLKVTGGYNLQGNHDTQSGYTGTEKMYYAYVSHPYITAGIRFQLKDDE